ncbi:hypothetical protein WJX77_009951 [Trebouxia sp. C0004]
MAEEALNLSLDDIIKRNAENNKRKSSAAGAARRGGRGGRGGGGSSFQPKGLGVQSRVVKTIRGGRGQSRGGRDRGAPRTERNYLKDPPRDNAALYGDASWKNDQYPQVVAAPRRDIRQRIEEPADGTKLNISNLDRNVTDIDIKELFQECGELKKCGVRFEPAGASMGTAFVWFRHPEAAQDAFQKYNNIALDGKPMRIEFDRSEKILTSGVRVGSRNGSGRVAAQGGRLFQNAAEKAQIGGRAVRPPSMRSSMRMDMD